MLRREWHGRRVLPERWIEASLHPCALNPVYGLLWWLNTGHGRYRSAHEDSFFAVGAGGNVTSRLPSQETWLLRWTDPTAIDTFIRFIMQALEE